MNTIGFRPLTEREHQALKKMLAVEFRDHLRLAEQVDGLAIRQRDETLFEFAPISGPTTDLRRETFAIPVECTYRDNDGAVVYVDIFVDERDALIELEVWKPDGSPVLTYFADANLLIKQI